MATGIAPPIPKKVILISGFVAQLNQRLEQSSYIRYSVNGGDAVDVPGKFDKGIVGKEQVLLMDSFLDLQEGSTLTLQLRQNFKGAMLRDVPGTRKQIDFNDILDHLEDAEQAGSRPDAERFEVYTDPKKWIWLKVEILASPKKSLAVSARGYTSPSNDLAQTPDPLIVAEPQIKAAMEMLKDFKSVLDRLGRAKGAVDIVSKIAMAISELHPVAKTVVRCMNLAYEQLKVVDENHKKMIELTRSMVNLIDDVRLVHDIGKYDGLKQTILTLPGLMTETAEFIEEWLGSWTARTPFTDSGGKILEYTGRLAMFKEEFNRRLDIDIRLAQELDKLERTLLGRIEFSPLAKECMKNTRVDLLFDIESKINDLDGNSIVWISGFPGVGKSALAATTVARMREQGKFVSYFVFDRAKSTTTTTNALWRRIAYDLARRYPSCRQSILQSLQKGDLDTNTRDAASLFDTLIKEPLLTLSNSTDVLGNSPCVFVVDGADECGGLDGSISQDRKDLLRTLKRWPELPKRFKLIITSRAENDISRTISSISAHIRIPSGKDLTDGTQASIDIGTYFQSRLQKIAEDSSAGLSPEWVSNAVDTLVPRAAGVFIWAVTVANFLERNPRSRFGQIIQHGLDASDLERTYTLYSTILQTSFGDAKDYELSTFLAVIGAVVFAKRPLEDIELTKLLRVDQSMLDYVRAGLSSVVDPQPPLRFVHQSFVDFLLSSACPLDFVISEPKQQHQLAQSCLNTMMAQLRFNICRFSTSFLKNTDLPEIDEKNNKNIPPLLSYSCRFWADHLVRAPFDEDLFMVVEKLLFNKLLFWLEVMSSLKQMNQVTKALEMVLDWSPILLKDADLVAFIRDALRFVATFVYPIAQSPLHIYLSALPFAPEQSLVAQRFQPRFPNTLTLTKGRPLHWPRIYFVTEHHKTGVSCLAFSTDEKTFAYADSRGKIFVCDSETGMIVSGPFTFTSRRLRKYEDHTIQIIAFSPNGKRIAAVKSEQIGVWDLESGEEGCKYQLDTQYQSWYGMALAWLDDRHVASASGSTESVISWHVDGKEQETRVLFQVPLHTNFAFSPDRRHLACAGGGVKIWNVLEGDFIQCKSEAASYCPVQVVSFTSDGRYVVCSNEPMYPGLGFFVFAAENGELIRPPFQIMTDFFYFHAYLPKNDIILVKTKHGSLMAGPYGDGDFHEYPKLTEGFGPSARVITPSRNSQRILVGGSDGTVRMLEFNEQIGELTDSDTATSLQRNEQQVKRIAFSPCGGKLASCSSNGIRVWDVKNDKVLMETVANRTATVAFSPDGKFLASSFFDHEFHGDTIHVQEAGTGEIIFSFPASLWDFKYTLFLSNLHLRALLSNEIHIWSLEGRLRNPIHTVMELGPPGEAVDVITISPDGLTALLWFAGVMYSSAEPIEVQKQVDPHRAPVQRRGYRFWSISSNQPLAFEFAELNKINRNSVVYSPTGRFVVSLNHARKLRVWDLTTGHFSKVFLDGNDSSRRLYDDLNDSLSNDIGENHSSRRLDYTNNSNSPSLSDNYGDRSSLRWLDEPNNNFSRQLKSVSDSDYDSPRWEDNTSDNNFPKNSSDTDSSRRSTSLGDYTPLRRPESDDDSTRWSDWQLAISPDEHFIASFDNVEVCIWDISTGHLVLGPWSGHTGGRPYWGNKPRLIFSPSGESLASYSADGTIRVWDTTDLTKPGQSRAMFTDSTRIEDGWVMGYEDREILFWVPLELRDQLYRSRNLAVIGDRVTKLDYTGFKYGENWEDCIDKEWLREQERDLVSEGN